MGRLPKSAHGKASFRTDAEISDGGLMRRHLTIDGEVPAWLLIPPGRSKRAVSVLQSLGANRIAVCGHSLGGHNAQFVATFDRRITAAITSCGFTSFAKYMGGNLTGWSHMGYMPKIAARKPEAMPFDFKDVLAAIAPRPVFVNAPLRDANFDASGVDDAVRDSRHPRIRVLHPDCEHDFPPEIRQQAYGWLDRFLT